MLYHTNSARDTYVGAGFAIQISSNQTVNLLWGRLNLSIRFDLLRHSDLYILY